MQNKNCSNESIAGFDTILAITTVSMAIAKNLDTAEDIATLGNIFIAIGGNLTVLANAREAYPKLAEVDKEQQEL